MAKIKEVEVGSIASGLGILPGDLLYSVNGHPIRDEIDLKFWETEEEFILEIGRDSMRRSVAGRKLAEQKLGISLPDLEFKRCNNRCIFCFYDQMPRGLRESLYQKDDDYRLSFLYGNYITLTNMNDDEFRRIEEQRLSPLFISVHAIDPGMRKRLLCPGRDADIKPHLQRLAEAGIEMHTQIVVCPEVNDGPEMSETVDALAEYHPQVRSVAVIPVGLTRYREGLFPLRLPDREECLEIVRKILFWQEGFRKRFGTGFVYPGDELLIRGEFAIPMKEFYDGFPQLENGVGNSRIFLDELDQLDTGDLKELHGSVVLLTSELPSPWIALLRKRLIRETMLSCEVVTVPNSLFGDTVTVSGLLAGNDVAGALRAYGRAVDLFLIPGNCLNEEGRFIDGISLDEVRSLTGTHVRAAPGCLGELPGMLQRELSK
jgi:putative radical SAM enzyme (TIGR03279 family)